MALDKIAVVFELTPVPSKTIAVLVVSLLQQGRFCKLVVGNRYVREGGLDVDPPARIREVKVFHRGWGSAWVCTLGAGIKVKDRSALGA